VEEISVFLALASPLLRIRLRTSLSHAPDIRLVGEVSAAAAAVQQLPGSGAQILLTERVLLSEPALSALLAGRDAPHVVLVTATGTGLAEAPAAPVARTLPFTLPPDQLATELRRVLIPPAEPPPPVVTLEVQQRFHITGPLDTSRASPRPAEPISRPAPRQAQGRRRIPSARQEQLVVALQALQQQQRDAVTGLAGAAVLEQVRALLPAAHQAVAFVGVEVQDEQGTAVAMSSLEPTLLRRLSATLRANVRREDLVCRTGPSSFMVVLPGVRWEEAAAPVERVRVALAESCQRQATAFGARLAVGVSYWEADAGTTRRQYPQ
jgi:GGDEF domain-containing protein